MTGQSSTDVMQAGYRSRPPLTTASVLTKMRWSHHGISDQLTIRDVHAYHTKRT